MLAVTDTGHGMDAITKSRIFEPFFTTKEPGKGTGLGLATVYGVVSQSGGFIWVETSPGTGTRFEIYLPAAIEKEDATSYERRAKRAERGSETVLIVEDDEEVRSLASEFLQGAGYHVLTAQDGQEALEISERMGSAVQLLLADVVMPKIRGPELARRLKARFPELRVVFMSGYLDQDTCREEILQEATVLQKPFSRDALLRQIRGAFDDEPCPEAAAEATYSYPAV
jgi:two-component system cell cycle sensor histidine kinase/response regulator CckA